MAKIEELDDDLTSPSELLIKCMDELSAGMELKGVIVIAFTDTGYITHRSNNLGSAIKLGMLQLVSEAIVRAAFTPEDNT